MPAGTETSAPAEALHDRPEKGGTDRLQEVLQNLLQKQKVRIDRVFSYAQAGEAARVRKYGQVLEESYEEDGIHIRAYVPKALAGELEATRK